MPIICGGTGFYIDSLVKNIFLPDVPPDYKLRKKLEKDNCEKLMKQLKKLDPKIAKTIDSKNKVKIIRAIEIAKKLGKVPEIKFKPIYDAIQIGLIAPDKILKERIKTRLLKRIKLGMLREGKKLHKQGLSWKRMEALGLEYRYMARHLSGKISLEQMINELNSKIWQFARRQKTWFRRDKEIKWYMVGSKSDKKISSYLIKEFIKN